MAQDSPEVDVFDSIINLEDQYHSEGYALGVADGARSGRIEGRVFGLEKGFEKFIQMGRLGGRAAILSARIPSTISRDDDHEPNPQVPPLRSSERLRKHIDRLSSLADPDEFTTENTEEAVSEVDARLKDAHTKLMLVAKIVGEHEFEPKISHETSASNSASDSTLRIRPDGNANHDRGMSNEMEDFVGLRQTQNG